MALQYYLATDKEGKSHNNEAYTDPIKDVSDAAWPFPHHPQQVSPGHWQVVINTDHFSTLREAQSQKLLYYRTE